MFTPAFKKKPLLLPRLRRFIHGENPVVVLRDHLIKEAVNDIRRYFTVFETEFSRSMVDPDSASEVMDAYAHELIEEVFSDTISLAFSEQTVIERVNTYLTGLHHVWQPDLENEIALLEREVLILVELVTNKLTEDHDYVGIDNYHLLRVLHSGALCFVPGDRRPAVRR